MTHGCAVAAGAPACPLAVREWEQYVVAAISGNNSGEHVAFTQPAR